MASLLLSVAGAAAGGAVFGPAGAIAGRLVGAIAPWWRRRLAYAFGFPGVSE